LDLRQAESSAAADLSSLVNNAFKTLQNPVLRAEYILREQGIDLSESEQTLEDPELLMGIMESREALDEATSQEQVDLIVSQTQGRFSICLCTLRLDTCLQTQ
jgi:molecular chaperone HscB